MTAFLLALLLAQPAPDESSRVVLHLAEQLGEALRLGEDDPAGAVRLLDALLDELETRELADHSAVAHVYRDSASYYRGHFRLRQGQAQAVADDMTALLDGKRARFLARVAGLAGTLASPLPPAAPVPHASLAAVLNFPPRGSPEPHGLFAGTGIARRGLQGTGTARQRAGRPHGGGGDQAQHDVGHA